MSRSANVMGNICRVGHRFNVYFKKEGDERAEFLTSVRSEEEAEFVLAFAKAD